MTIRSHFPAFGAVLACAAFVAALGGSAAALPLTFTSLHLVNGWTTYSSETGNPTAAADGNNVVHLRGAMRQPSVSSNNPFTLPLKYRPNRTVYVPVDLINGAPGRLVIYKEGTVLVEAADIAADARGFTSLEGVTFSRN